MYNNRIPQAEGIFTIRGDMCYDNKLMTGVTTSTTVPTATVLIDNPTDVTTCKRKSSTRFRKYIRSGPTLDIILFILALAFVGLVEYGFLPHTKQGFYCQDASISHKFVGDTITPVVLGLVTVLLPVMLFYMVEASRTDGGASLRLMAKWYRVMVMGQVTFLTVCQILKCTTGELRPHFLDTCQPNAAEHCEKGTFITEYQCTNVKNYRSYQVSDASLSFPSGHSGIAAFTSVYSCIYIINRFSNRRTGTLLKLLLGVLVLSWGPVTALSRVTDHRHHWWDVFVGLTMGASFGVFTVAILCRWFRTPTRSVLNGSRCMGGVSSSCTGGNKGTCADENYSTTSLVDVQNKDATSMVI